MKSVGKQRIRILCLAAVFVLLLPAAILVWVRAGLPYMAEHAARLLAPHVGLSNLSLTVQTLSRKEIVLKRVLAGPQTCRGLEIGTIRIEISGADNSPHQLRVSDATLRLLSADGEWMIPGVQFRQPFPVADRGPAPLVDTLRLPEALLGFLNPGFSAAIEETSVKLIRRTATGDTSATLPIVFKAELGQNGHLTISARGKAEEAQLLALLPPEISCSNVEFQVDAAAILHRDRACEALAASATLKVDNLRYETGHAVCTIPSLTITIEATQADDEFHGVLTADFAGAEIQAASWGGSAISGSLPLAFRYTDRLIIDTHSDSRQGRIDLGSITVAQRSIGGGRIQYAQKGPNLLAEGKLDFAPVGVDAQSQSLSLAASLTLPSEPLQNRSATGDMSAEWRPASFDLGSILPGLGKTIMSGSFRADADAVFGHGQWLISAALSLSGASIEQKARAFSIEGLDGKLALPDISRLRTSPEQKLSFANLSLGDLRFQNGSLAYQLESPGRLFLEKFRTQWCGGRVDAGALRIHLDKPKEVDLILFCDDIEVAELLSQLNVASAAGEGRVAGRIPVRFSDGNLEIDQGFLHSIPGKKGRIRLVDLAQSEITEPIHLAIAREALKDYSYNWLRLTVGTVKHTLLARLEMDGMPAEKLPFTYDATTFLKRAEGKEQGSTFQGISFDINFAIPINDILYYGRNTGKLFTH